MIFVLVFFFIRGMIAQVDQRCKLSDTVFIDNCVLELEEFRFSLHPDWITGEYFSAESASLLDSLVIFLRLHPNIELLLEAHTDARGSAESNKIPSENRAKSIKEVLVRRGMDPVRIRTKGYGEYKPVFVYLVDGNYYQYLNNSPKKAEIVELTEKYINQFQRTEKTTFERLHQYNRRTNFQVFLKKE